MHPVKTHQLRAGCITCPSDETDDSRWKAIGCILLTKVVPHMVRAHVPWEYPARMRTCAGPPACGSR